MPRLVRSRLGPHPERFAHDQADSQQTLGSLSELPDCHLQGAIGLVREGAQTAEIQKRVEEAAEPTGLRSLPGSASTTVPILQVTELGRTSRPTSSL